jgi:imidazolonepropionase
MEPVFPSSCQSEKFPVKLRRMGTLVLTEIGQLLTMDGPDAVDATLGVGRAGDAAAIARAELSLRVVTDACLVICDGTVRFAGPRDEAPALHTLPGPVRQESVAGRLVTPALVDPHTHLIWAGDRSEEFDLRNRGATYQEIQARGGGILSTVRATAQASDEALLRSVRRRLRAALQLGVTTCEIKTGYGLYPDAELRLLRILRQAQQEGDVVVAPTFLCHVPPPELGSADSESRQAFVQGLCAVAPQAQALGATSIDVYCDAGAFTQGEATQILQAGQRSGLHLRCHAEQFTYTGIAEQAARLGARSVEHLEEIDEAGVVALAQAGVVAHLLPGAVVTLRLRWPDARRLIQRGVRVALGSDCNPGSSYTQSLSLMMALACTQMGLSTAEAWLAVTRHAAQSLAMPDAGVLRPGSRGDAIVWDAESPREVCQRLGDPLIQRVYRRGAPIR